MMLSNCVPKIYLLLYRLVLYDFEVNRLIVLWHLCKRLLFRFGHGMTFKSSCSVCLELEVDIAWSEPYKSGSHMMHP